MGLIFKKEHIELIEKGIKTQTRRKHKYLLKAGKIYKVKKNWFQNTELEIFIKRVYRQKLGDIKPEEAFKEGGYTIKEFKEIWIQINGSWDNNEVVIVYDFKLVNRVKPKRLNGFFHNNMAFLIYIYSIIDVLIDFLS